MSRRVACVAFDGDNAAGIEPADISGRGAFDDNFRVRQAHGADTLPRVRDVKFQRATFGVPQRAANVVLTARRNVKIRFARLNSRFNLKQKVLRRHAFMISNRVNF